MLKQCIFCSNPLGANESVERFPVGKRVAFDNKRGRLWAICSACHRWNLAPIEERWEALEDLEKLTRDRGRLLSQTENIALVRAEDIELVHVGRAPLAEEAWWRYGRELMRRRRQNFINQAAHVAILGGFAALSGFSGLFFASDPVGHTRRWLRFGKTAWRGEKQCPRCGTPLTAMSFARSRYLQLHPTYNQQDAWTQTGFEVELRCKRCGFFNRDGGFVFAGDDATRLIRRVTAYYNYQGARDTVIKDAVADIDRAGSPQHLLQDLARKRYQIRSGRKQRDVAIALEISVNDETERELLQMELKALEDRWREEEELAAIIDGELTHLPALERLRRKLR